MRPPMRWLLRTRLSRASFVDTEVGRRLGRKSAAEQTLRRHEDSDRARCISRRVLASRQPRLVATSPHAVPAVCKADCCHVRADCPDAPTRTACFYSRESCTLCTTTSDTSLICVTSLFSSRESSTPSTTQLALLSRVKLEFLVVQDTRVFLCRQIQHSVHNENI